MAPINLPDGSQVSEIVLPDGSTASEVLAPDGSTVFSAIPDSADYYWGGDSFETGDANWTDQVSAVDAAVSGDPQSGTLSDGSAAVVGDGNGDNLTWAAADNDWGDEIDTGAAVEIVIQTTNSNKNPIWGVDATQAVQFFINTDGDFNESVGTVHGSIKDGSGNFLTIASGDVGINDGNRHDVSLNIIDPSTNDIELIVDGTSYTTPTRTQSPSGFSDFGDDIIFMGRTESGSVQGPIASSFGAVMVHNTNIVEQKISQFP
jgi:hypothetical protein